MNHPNDHSPNSPAPGGDNRGSGAELEARLVAWIAGEASPFEIAELERLVREQPALAVLKRRLETVHGLVADAAKPDREPLRLAPERRAKLLAALGAPNPESAATAPAKNSAASKPASAVVVPFAAQRKKKRQERAWIFGVAACLAFGTFFAVFTNLGSMHSGSLADVAALQEKKAKFERAREASQNRAVAAPEPKQRGDVRPTFDFASHESALAEPAPTVAYDANGDSVGVLSPFEVKAESDTGYRASNTLAGTRLNSSLRDVSSAITVTTPEFLKDVGAADSVPVGIDQLGKQRRDLPNVTWGAGAPPPAGEPAPMQEREAQTGGIATGGKSGPADDDGIVVLAPFAVSSDRGAANAKDEDRAAPKIRQVAGAEHERKELGLAEPPDAPNPAGRIRGLDGIAAASAPAKPVVSADKKSDAPKTVLAGAADQPLPRPVAPLPPPAAELSAAQDPFSTFSLHVGDVSFRLAQKALAAGSLPDPATIRAEEFYNAFNYGDAAPAPAEKVGCRLEQAAHPSLQQRNLVRIAVKVPSTGRGAGTPLRLTVLLDTSGSMEREDRAATVRAALRSLISLLGANDRLTLIGFSRQPRLLAEAVPGDRAAAALAQLGAIPSDGGTNLEEALKLGRELALRHFAAAAQNRLVVLTDGAANLGNADPAALSALVEKLRAERIAFDACGVGLDGLDDTMLEALTRRGDGRYTVLDSPAAADAGFARQLAGAFRPAAANVKLQVRFNPARVGRYRLLGFEKHRLRTEDFRNDAVDAAELAADEAAVAVYQIEALPQGEGELGDVFVRFRDTATGTMVERSWTMTYDAHAPAFDRAPAAVQLAGTAALFAELLRDRPADLAERLDELAPVVNSLRGKFPAEPRVQQFAVMFDQARRLARR